MKSEQQSGSRRGFWASLGRALGWTLLIVAVLVGGVMAYYWNQGRRSGDMGSTAGVLVLEDSDPDFRTPPFEDAVLMFGPDGNSFRKVGDLSISETVGGCRAISVAPDGRSFLVRENVGNQLIAYQLDTGKRLWSFRDETNAISAMGAATVAPDGLVYALASDGTIYGKKTLVMDPAGKVVREAPLGGFDLTLDAERRALWLVGKNLKRCDLDLKVQWELDEIGWCAVSVDLDADGAAWVAERNHPDVTQSTNRLLRISTTGKVLGAVGLPFSPMGLRVDRSDDGVWVTGVAVKESAVKRLLDALERRTGRLPLGQSLREVLTRPSVWWRTYKYDSAGVMQVEIRQGGFSLDLDPTDGSVWLGGREQVYRYSRQGAELGRSGKMTACQRWVVVVPGH